MAYELYDLVIPRFRQTLTAMPNVFDKAIAYCEAKRVDPDVLLQARLAPDMNPFRWQVLATLTHTAGAIGALISGKIEMVAGHEDLNSLVTLKAAIKDALQTIENVDAAWLNALSDKDVSLKAGAHELNFTAAGFLTSFSLPNHYFHATTAYAILRSNGVDLGKRDFLGPLEMKR